MRPFVIVEDSISFPCHAFQLSSILHPLILKDYYFADRVIVSKLFLSRKRIISRRLAGRPTSGHCMSISRLNQDRHYFVVSNNDIALNVFVCIDLMK